MSHPGSALSGICTFPFPCHKRLPPKISQLAVRSQWLLQTGTPDLPIPISPKPDSKGLMESPCETFLLNPVYLRVSDLPQGRLSSSTHITDVREKTWCFKLWILLFPLLRGRWNRLATEVQWRKERSKCVPWVTRQIQEPLTASDANARETRKTQVGRGRVAPCMCLRDSVQTVHATICPQEGKPLPKLFAKKRKGRRLDTGPRQSQSSANCPVHESTDPRHLRS